MKIDRRLNAVAALAVSVTSVLAQPYRVTPLVSDGTVAAPNIDTNLVNAWGVAFNPQGFVWVNDNGTGKATLYSGTGVPQSLVVDIPSVPNSTDAGAPTGIVFSGGTEFSISNGTTSGAAAFIFATEDGTISAWSPPVDLHHALIAADHSGLGAIYKGLAIAAVGSGHRLYATDFANNRVDVLDGGFNYIMVPGRFADPTLPPLYAPFGIQAIDDAIIVTYAKKANAHSTDEEHGPGLGIVNLFDTNGRHLARVASHGVLNAPWGIALAPHNFGPHSDQLLIGNFGNGRINAFELEEHEHHWGHEPRFEFAGALRTDRGRRIEIPGLWGIAFGNGLNNQPVNTLFFAAGPNDEAGGLYGRIDPGSHH